MSAVDDEDVVFQGSQLYNHLIDVGLDEELEVAAMKEPPTSSGASQLLYIQNKSQLRTLLGNIKNRMWNCLTPIRRLFMNGPRHKQHLKDVWGYNLLFDEDKKWITFSGAPRLSICNVNAVSCSYWLGVWNSGYGSLLKVPGLCMLAVSIALWLKRDCQHRHNRRCLNHLLTELQIFTSVAKKSFRLIQEREALERGYTLTRIGGFLGDSDKKTLPGIRDTLSQALIKTADLVCAATLDLVKLHPLRGHADDPSHYMALFSSYSLNCEVDRDSTKQLRKDLLCLIAMESEIVRRLALCFCPAVWETRGDHYTNPQVFNLCQNLAVEISYQRHKVEFELGMAKKVFLPEANPKEHVREMCNAPGCLDVAIALHSAALHCKILSDALICAEELALTASSDKNPEVITSLMSQCDASNSCLKTLESCVSVAELHLAKLKFPQEVILPVASSLDCKDMPFATVIPVGTSDLDLTADVLEIFEAQSYAEHIDDSFKEDDVIFSTSRVNMEVNQSLFSELQNVLSVRAEEMRKREARTKGVPYEPIQKSNIHFNIDTSQKMATEEILQTEFTIDDKYSIQDDVPESGVWPLPRLPDRPHPPRAAKTKFNSSKSVQNTEISAKSNHSNIRQELCVQADPTFTQKILSIARTLPLGQEESYEDNPDEDVYLSC